MSTKQIMRTMVYCGYLLIYNLIFFFIMGNQIQHQTGSHMFCMDRNHNFLRCAIILQKL
mgnify:CR=1 FL=1